MFDFLLDIGNYDQRKIEVDNISGNDNVIIGIKIEI